MKDRRTHIYEAVINRMVRQALEAKESEFALNHANDTDAQLLDYLVDEARRLHHTPWPREIVGGKLLLERFGTWEHAISSAGLLPMTTSNNTSQFALYKKELEIQKNEYRLKKLEKKRKAAQRQKAKDQKPNQ